MDIHLPHLKESRHLDNESNDSGLSSETSQNSKERAVNMFDSRNLSSMRAVHFALDNHRKMTSQKHQSVSTIERRPLKFISTSDNEVLDSPTLKSKPPSQLSPFLVKINPKSLPCGEYVINETEQLQLPESEHIEIGCEYSFFKNNYMNVQTTPNEEETCQFEDDDSSHTDSHHSSSHHSSPLITIYQNYNHPIQEQKYQLGYESNLRPKTSNVKVVEEQPETFQNRPCVHSTVEMLNKSKDTLSSFRLLLSTRETLSKLKLKNHCEKSFSGLLFIDILHAENLQMSTSIGGCLRLLQCIVKVDSECRAETSTEIFGDKIIWDERFSVDIREAIFISFLLFQTYEGCNKRLSYYGGINLIDLLSDLSSESQTYDQIVVQLEPRGLLYIQLALIPLCESLPRGLCCSFGKNPTHSSQPNVNYIYQSRNLSDWIYVSRWCIATTEEKQRLSTLNLYKITSSDTKTNSLLKHVLNSRFHGAHLPEDITTHSVTSLLIISLREMPDSLIPVYFWEKIHEIIERCFNYYDPAGQYMASEVYVVLKTLPNLNQIAVFELLQHLYSVIQYSSQNKTSCHYIATLFAPLLFYGYYNKDREYNKFPDNCEVEIIKCLLDNWYSIQDTQNITNIPQIRSDRNVRTQMVSVAIQTDEDKNKNQSLTSRDFFDSNIKTVYKSILKKPTSNLHNINNKSKVDLERTTFI